MAENEGGDGGKTGAFLLGFLVGVVVCLGVGGTLFAVQLRKQTLAEMQAREAAEIAHLEAMRAADEARKQRELAEKALRDAKEAVEKKGREPR